MEYSLNTVERTIKVVSEAYKSMEWVEMMDRVTEYEKEFSKLNKIYRSNMLHLENIIKSVTPQDFQEVLEGKATEVTLSKVVSSMAASHVTLNILLGYNKPIDWWFYHYRSETFVTLDSDKAKSCDTIH
jgi:hypothetical protein